MIGVLILHTIPTIIALLIAYGHSDQVPQLIKALQRSSVVNIVSTQDEEASRYAKLSLKPMPPTTTDENADSEYLANIYNNLTEALDWSDSYLRFNLYEWAIYVAILWDAPRLQEFITDLWQTTRVDRVALLHCPKYDPAVVTGDAVRKLLGLGVPQSINDEFPTKCRLMRAQFARPLEYFEGLRLNQFSSLVLGPSYLPTS
ncbi:hypothetical protein H4R35_003175 [Dimargaris xerosporica]|nr:hypothetical protein H4R35_003175 [Dimargaris xerosporica]